MNTTPLKTALVTGGARRIGAAIVRDLAANGYRVAIHASSSLDEAAALHDEIAATGGEAWLVTADLSGSEGRDSLIAATRGRLGPIGLLVNNASIFQRDGVDDFDEALFDAHFALHVKAPTVLTRDFARQLPQDVSGLVVNIIDQRVWSPTPRFYSYTLSKAALYMATKTAAQALAPHVRVNAIGPGPTLPAARQTEADFRKQVSGLIMKKGAGLDEFGRTIRFLHETPSITGQMIALDGGQHLAWQTPDAEVVE
ncbi:MAG: SDR family oxidoreductase [Rhizobiaceae bacterium]|nr:SDR family oxidoreductase [Rhizobiaceae bacterium]